MVDWYRKQFHSEGESQLICKLSITLFPFSKIFIFGSPLKIVQVYLLCKFQKGRKGF